MAFFKSYFKHAASDSSFVWNNEYFFKFACYLYQSQFSMLLYLLSSNLEILC